MNLLSRYLQSSTSSKPSHHNDRDRVSSGASLVDVSLLEAGIRSTSHGAFKYSNGNNSSGIDRRIDDTHNSIRVLVVGDNFTGKTSLCQALTSIAAHSEIGRSGSKPKHGAFGNNAHAYMQTVGANIHLMLQPYSGIAGSEDYFIELIDVGGHQRYQQARSIYYHRLHAIILAFDTNKRGSYAHLRQWISELQQQHRQENISDNHNTNAPAKPNYLCGIPALIVGCKRDEASYDINTLHQYFSSQRDYSIDSCFITNVGKHSQADMQPIRSFFERVITAKHANAGHNDSSYSGMYDSNRLPSVPQSDFSDAGSDSGQSSGTTSRNDYSAPTTYAYSSPPSLRQFVHTGGSAAVTRRLSHNADRRQRNDDPPTMSMASFLQQSPGLNAAAASTQRHPYYQQR